MNRIASELNGLLSIAIIMSFLTPGAEPESGMTLAQAPAGPRAVARGVLFPAGSSKGMPGGRAAQPVTDNLGSAVAISGTTAVVGAAGVNDRAGAAYIYVRSPTRWRLRASVTDPDGIPGDSFGSAVAVSGTTVMVGAPGASHGAGVAYVYIRSGMGWRLQATLSGPGGSAAGNFGTSVALSGNAAVVGAPGVNGDEGAAYVYVRSGTRWRKRAGLTDPADAHSDLYGTSVAISGTTVVVGAPHENATSGAAFVYVPAGTGWRMQAALSNPSGVHAFFGASVAVSGATALIGYGVELQAGAAVVYVRSGTHWRIQAVFADPGGSDLDNFGWAVALSGATALVGAIGVNLAGAAYVYVRSAGSWHRQAKMPDPGGHDRDGFGTAVALSGATALVGAPGKNNDAGAAYAYARSGVSWPGQAGFTNPRGVLGRFYGASVAISGATAIVGAPGVNGDSGAVYVYVRSGSRWHRQATLPAPDDFSYDYFGEAVALSGTTALIGAFGASSVNVNSGAAYVYVRSGSRWHRQATLPGPRGVDAYFGWAVAISSAVAVVGAAGSEAAYVYVRSGTRWRRQATLPDPGGAGAGVAVALSGPTALVSATAGGAKGAGVAYVYVRSGSRWHRQATLPDPGGRPGDDFGTSVAISGATAVIGANGMNSGAGKAYIYVRSGISWNRQTALTDPLGTSSAGGFGGAVAISGTTSNVRVLISGLRVSGVATGPRQCGHAFEFTRAGRRWHERARVADPNCRSYDDFGDAVGISGVTAVIGAPGAHHNDGDVYLYKLPGPEQMPSLASSP